MNSLSKTKPIKTKTLELTGKIEFSENGKLITAGQVQD